MKILIALLLAGAGYLAYSKRAQLQSFVMPSSSDEVLTWDESLQQFVTYGEPATLSDKVQVVGLEISDAGSVAIAAVKDALNIGVPVMVSAELSANELAFIALIIAAEGTAKGGRDPYRTCYGYKHTIQSFAEHPAVSGEWAGEKLSDQMCINAGQSPGCVSTAAGAGQIIRKTWISVRNKLKLKDFSPRSQQLAILELVRQRGALENVRAGEISEAVRKCRKEWASLPGAGYGQGERSLDFVLSAYKNAGGSVA